jgi:beta-lysine 5,6-aminomutase beta subunit
VTQRDAHLHHVREVVAAAAVVWPQAERPLIVVGGPRFDPRMTAELGVDRVFGKGTTPREVASYLVHALAHRRAA